ncbi:hypothetical protein CY35_14G058300 [Sphagnum magellanicum]|nr:hypothetical protein CY35_14G058300 [Sphagnum magellanicum]
MTYMHPTYIPFPTPATIASSSKEKYGFYLYHEGWKKIDYQLHLVELLGVPVLFIPGNGGSYKQMPLIAAESDRAYNGGPLDGKYYQHSSFTPLEARLVQEGTNFLMEEYTFRLSVLYFKDLGQLDKSVSEQLPSRIKGLVQDGHLQNAHASLLQVLHGAYPAYGLTVK